MALITLRASSVIAVLQALATMTPMSSADYISKSILCDDIPAICEFNDLPYENNNKTICGEQERFLNPEICNCGHKCISYLKEGDSCATSSTMYFPTELCGPRLECLSDNLDQSDAKCAKNKEKPCINELIAYESDTELGQVGPGQYRPNCDEYGRYAGRQCSPGSTCYCVNNKGDRLFGEAPTTQKTNMTCDCAAYWYDTQARGLDQGLRCLANGNFDPLICLDDLCYCYDPAAGTVDGPYPMSILTDMPCYNKEYHNPDYINPCHRAQMEYDSQGGNSLIIVGERGRPVCNHDGYYAPVQRIGPRAYCVDRKGVIISGNYSQPLHLVESMTCNCARRRAVMVDNGLSASKPKCCQNGEYFPWQTRGLLAFCVDVNGNQKKEEKAITDVMSLECYTEDPCEDPNPPFP